jgi:hypothetical protein
MIFIKLLGSPFTKFRHPWFQTIPNIFGYATTNGFFTHPILGHDFELSWCILLNKIFIVCFLNLQAECEIGA